jgi:hypothetical protein
MTEIEEIQKLENLLRGASQQQRDEIDGIFMRFGMIARVSNDDGLSKYQDPDKRFSGLWFKSDRHSYYLEGNELMGKPILVMELCKKPVNVVLRWNSPSAFPKTLAKKLGVDEPPVL